MLIELTNNLIEKGASTRCGYNYDQLKLLGVSTPPVHGWKNDLIGKSILQETYNLFLKIKGIEKKKRKIFFDEIKNACEKEYGI